MKIVFRREYPWALLPTKPKIDVATAREKAEMYEASFRWVRRRRAGEFCFPWRMGEEIGWVIPSPVDVEIGPFREYELDWSEEEGPALSTVFGHDGDIWRREDGTALWVEKAPWLRLFDFEGRNGWESMFVPNGDGTVEWRLGWSAKISVRSFLLILPAARRHGFEAVHGLLDEKTLNRHDGIGIGFSIAIRPLRKSRIRRGDPLARVVPLHKDSVTAVADYVG